MTTLYRHTQAGTLIRICVGVPGILMLAAGIFQGWNRLLMGAAVLLGLLAFLFHALTVEVSDGRLRCWFGPGLFRKTFSLDEVAEVAVVRNRWYYGWGMRLTPYGWLFNVSGLDAVQLTLASGRRFRIGTDEPAELARAIEQGAQRRHGTPGKP